MREKRLHLHRAQFAWMTPSLSRSGAITRAMKLQITADPLAVRAFGSQRIMMKSHHLPDLIEQPRFGIWNQPLPFSPCYLCHSQYHAPFFPKYFWTKKKAKNIVPA